MTRRKWMLALGLGLLPGCMPPALQRPPAVIQSAPPPCAGPQADMHSARPVEVHPSPYRPVPVQPVPERDPATQAPPLPPEPPVWPDATPAVRPEAAIIQQVVAAVPADDPALIQALRCFLDHRPEDALNHLQTFGTLNQDLMMRLMVLMGLLTECDIQQAPAQELSPIVEQLQNILGQLQARAPLVIEQMCFCKTIRKFGDYEPLAAGHDFRPGDRVQVYVEVRNFTVEQRGPLYLTHLSSSIEVRDFHKQLAWRADFLEENSQPDRSRTPRRDYFANFQFCVPRDLPPGKYTLWILIRDAGKPGQEPARRSLDFRVLPAAVRGN